MNFEYKNVLIFGYSKSGKAVEAKLIDLKVNYMIYDDNLKISGGHYLYSLNKKILIQFDLIVVSPGISINNAYLKHAESVGIKVISELEFGYIFCDKPIVAVTGTDGKTTTVQLIEHILNVSGIKAKAMGNIGEPFTNLHLFKNVDVVVLEVSSFMLEATRTFKPHIGVIINIDCDHLDRHITLSDYILTKISLFKNCLENETAILNGLSSNITNYENKICAKKKLYFNKQGECVGTYIHNNKIVINFNEEENKVFCDLKEIKLKTHIDNILCAITVCKLFSLENKKILKAINSFVILGCRIEHVKTINKINFINDSKASNIHACKNAVEQIKTNIVLLVGGQNKKLDFTMLFKELSLKVKQVVAFGNAKKEILKAAKKCRFNEIVLKKDLVEAVLYAYKIANEGETILLSPACASFDNYNSYVQRGEHFVNIVNDINKFFNLEYDAMYSQVKLNNIIKKIRGRWVLLNNKGSS